MAAPLLYTKLYQPAPRSGMTARLRLLARLEETLRPGVRLTMVSAPAGYGKTTLVASWLASLNETQPEMAVAWLSLDEGDNDPARFLSYLISALRKIQPELGAGLLTLLSLPQLPPLDALIGELINELGTIEQPFLIVLDDFHVLHSPELSGGLEFFLERMPPHARLVITTREDPPLPLSRMRVRGEVIELRANDLRFTVDEAGIFFCETLGQNLDEAALKALESRTEGWIAGLQLAALALRETGDDPEARQNFLAAFSGSHRYVIDYLVDEVLARQPEEVRNFLLYTSVLDRFSAELCAAVMEIDEKSQSVDQSISEQSINDQPIRSNTSSRITNRPITDYSHFLVSLERSNLFLFPLDGGRKWYRYHRLFSDVLRAGLDAETEAALHRRAAQWWEQHGEVEEAIRHALAGQIVDEACRLIAAHAMDFVGRSGLVTVMNWLNQLPESAVLADPDLSIIKSLGLMMTGQITQAIALFSQIPTPEAGDASPAARVRAGRHKTIAAWLYILQNDPRSLPLAEEAADLLRDVDPYFYVYDLIPLGSMLRAVRKDLAGSTRAFTEAFEIGERTNNLFGAAGGLANLLFNLIETSRMQEAKQVCLRVFQKYVDARGRPLPIQGLVYIPYSVILLTENHLEEAAQYARRGLELCQMLFSSLMMGGDGEMVLAQVLFWRGEHEQAFALIEEVREAAKQRNLVAFVIRSEIMSAHLHLRRGDLPVVQRWVEDKGLRDPEQLQQALGEYQHIYARLLMAEGKGEEACAILEAIDRKASFEVWDGARIGVLIRLALFKYRLGKTSAAVEHMRQALQMAAGEGYRFIFIREGQDIAPLLTAARDAAPAFVDDLLGQIGVQSASQPSSGQTLEAPQKAVSNPTSNLPEPLSEQEINVLRLLAAGKSNQEIADQLYISVGTAKWHVHNILGKLEVSSRTQAIAKARELNIR